MNWFSWTRLPINLPVIAAVDRNVEAVRQLLLTRSQVGIDKYGTTTDNEESTSEYWLNHLQEELMDASVYCQALKQKLDEENKQIAWHTREIQKIIEGRK